MLCTAISQGLYCRSKGKKVTPDLVYAIWNWRMALSGVNLELTMLQVNSKSHNCITIKVSPPGKTITKKTMLGGFFIMSRCKVMSMVIIIGLGIGCIVSATTFWWANKDRADSALNSLDSEAILVSEASAKESYHFELEQGVLSVIEGKPGVKGNVIVTGLSVESWPKEILEIAHKVEFYSLDEVQSFIDTATESLWLE